MYEAAVLGTVIMMVISAADYTRRAWKRETNPVPATWILAVVMFSLSLWMYWASPRRSWTANIAVTAGLANTTAILIGVIAANVRYGTLRIAFDTTASVRPRAQRVSSAESAPGSTAGESTSAGRA